MALGANKAALLGAAGSSTTSAYTIDQSIRFNSADSAYLYRTPSSASDRRTFTISFWFKSTVSGVFQTLIGAYDNSSASDSTYFGIWQGSTGNMGFGTWNSNPISTTRKIRDPSAWFHCVYVIDTTNPVGSERCRLYINGIRETAISYNDPGLNHQFGWNLNQQHSIGRINYTSGSGPYYTNGYLAEIHNIDGYAYDPSYFGEFNNSGIWIPKEYTGSYGTNGFKIDGRDSSDLGDDESGNGNDFTASGLAAHDQVLDSPTNNFAVFNSVMTEDSDFEFTEGNLKLDMNTNKSWYVGAGASMSMSSGKWYWESYWNSGDSYTIWGILDTEQLHTLAGSGSSSIYALNFNGIQPNSSGTNDQYRQGQGGSAIATGQAGAPGGIWQFALDMDNKKMWLGYNGTYIGSGDPGGGTNETWSSTYIASSSYTPINQGYQISAHSILTYNFGQDSTFAGATTAGGNSDGNGIGNFKYSVPSGFKALCTKNLGS